MQTKKQSTAGSEAINTSKPPSQYLEQALKKAQERREKFERENSHYVEEHLEQVI